MFFLSCEKDFKTYNYEDEITDLERSSDVLENNFNISLVMSTTIYIIMPH